MCGNTTTAVSIGKNEHLYRKQM